ncbi:MAG: RNA methyltransferase [Prevotella sp.]|nr:RNA methyltransferase [Candidatus Prevotella equi]
MISKNKIKYIHSLEQKKQRKEEKAFVAEGHKSVGDLLKVGRVPKFIVATQEWQSPVKLKDSVEYIEVTEDELRKASLLLHPQQVLAVFPIENTQTLPDSALLKSELCLALDGVQDPGNLGTIIRTADWFGIKHIICSHSTADLYNPKVVQATMGSIARVNIYYTDLPMFFEGLDKDIPVYGTLLDGNDIYSTELSNNGVIVMGNEGNGISKEVRECLTHKLLIPSFPANRDTAESLNVSIATAIICSEFRRRS